ncbi:MAG: hypothetical protein R3E01_00310 [Pirellulaceae bacterium]|nr:hypothetical protein [Planctomycetales bacterium]
MDQNAKTLNAAAANRLSRLATECQAVAELAGHVAESSREGDNLTAGRLREICHELAFELRLAVRADDGIVNMSNELAEVVGRTAQALELNFSSLSREFLGKIEREVSKLRMDYIDAIGTIEVEPIRTMLDRHLQRLGRAAEEAKGEAQGEEKSDESDST